MVLVNVELIEVIILGIESSCDETAAAVVEEGRRVRSSVVASQLDAQANIPLYPDSGPQINRRDPSQSHPADFPAEIDRKPQ